MHFIFLSSPFLSRSTSIHPSFAIFRLKGQMGMGAAPIPGGGTTLLLVCLTPWHGPDILKPSGFSIISSGSLLKHRSLQTFCVSESDGGGKVSLFRTQDTQKKKSAHYYNIIHYYIQNSFFCWLALLQLNIWIKGAWYIFFFLIQFFFFGLNAFFTLLLGKFQPPPRYPDKRKAVWWMMGGLDSNIWFSDNTIQNGRIQKLDKCGESMNCCSPPASLH